MPDRDIIIRIKASNLTKAELDKARRQIDKLDKSAKGARKGFPPLGKEVQRLSRNFAQMNPVTASASNLLGGASVAALGAVGAVAGLGATVAASVSHLRDLGVELTTLRDQTKLSTDFLQEMRFVSSQVNVGFEQVTQSVVRLGRRTAADLPETRRFVESLGLSMEEIIAMEPEQQFLRIVDAISQIDNPSQQAAAAMGIFGDAGLQILPLLRADIQQLRDDFQDLGGRIDKDVLESARRFDDAMTDLKTTASGLAGEIGGPLLQSLTDATEQLVEFIKRRNELDQRAARAEVDPVLAALLERRQEAAPSFDFLFGPQAGDPEALAQIEKQIELRQDVLDQVERLQEAIGDSNREIDAGNDLLETAEERARRLAEAEKRRAEIERNRERVLAPLVALQRQNAEWTEEAAFHTDVLEREAAEAEQNFRQIGGVVGGVIPPAVEGIGDLVDEAGEGIHDAVMGVGDLEGQTRQVEEAQRAYNDALAAANDLAQLIGGNVGRLVGQTVSAAAALENLSSIGGIGGAFRAGRGEAEGLLGILGGLGGVLETAGPFLGLGASLVGAIGGLFGRDAEDVARDIGRDIGATISEGLAEQILESDLNPQLFLREIFQEGGLGVDDLARETADLFSFLERGEISEGTLIAELRDVLPILIQNLRELGPAGEAEIQRIIGAAERFGIELDEIHQLMQGTFAPQTMEEIAAQFDLTNDQVRELGERLGVEVQTNLERMAASLGLTVDQMKELGAAAEEEFGVGLEELDDLLAAMGVSADELASALGVDLGDVQSDTEAAANETERAAGFATIFADEMERAGRAAGGISLPGGGTPGVGFPTGTPGLDFVDFGQQTLAPLHGTEAVIPQSRVGDFARQLAAALRGMGGGGAGRSIVNITVVASNPRELIRQLRDEPELQNELVQVVS